MGKSLQSNLTSIFILLISSSYLSLGDHTNVRPEQVFRDPRPSPSDYNHNAQAVPMSSVIPAAATATADASATNIPTLSAPSAGMDFKSGSNTYSPYSTQFDEQIDNSIAESVLQFALNAGKNLNHPQSIAIKSEAFSPVSILSILSSLMLGSKGKSYQELKDLFALDLIPQLRYNPSQFHEEFGKMLQDLEASSLTANVNEQNAVRKRPNTLWRETEARNNIRSSNQVHDQVKEHVIRIASGLFIQTGYSLNPSYR